MTVMMKSMLAQSDFLKITFSISRGNENLSLFRGFLDFNVSDGSLVDGYHHVIDNMPIPMNSS